VESASKKTEKAIHSLNAQWGTIPRVVKDTWYKSINCKSLWNVTTNS